MHDAILLETLGTPAVSLVTHVFTNTAQEMAQLMGVPEFPFVVVEHPLSSLVPDEIRRRAEKAAPQVQRLLLRGKL